MNVCVWIGGTIVPVLQAPAVYMYNTCITRFVDFSFVVYCMLLEPHGTIDDPSPDLWDDAHPGRRVHAAMGLPSP